MATFKVLLDTRRALNDGTYPLVLRIYNGDKYSTIKLKAYLKENQFDEIKQRVKRTHPNEKVINQRIKQAILQVEKTALNFELKDEIISADKIKANIVKPKSKFGFIAYAESIIAQMRAVGRNGNADAYRDAINALKSYTGKAELDFIDVNYELLSSLENKMLVSGLRKNSIAAYNRAWRAVFNKAVNENLVEVKYYPYRKYKIKCEPTAKRNISLEDMSAIVKADVAQGTPQWHARNYFLLSYNLRGISFADMASIKLSSVTNGRLIYHRRKTHKLYSIKLTDMAKEILSYYQSPNSTYILPIIPEAAVNNPVEERKYIQYATKTCNRHLRHLARALDITDNLSTYYSRHSWATIAKKLGYSKDLISEALGHSYGNRVTEIYLDSFDQEVIDAMNEAVCKI